MNVRRIGFTGALAIALILAACGGDDDSPTSKIFDAPPWQGNERAVYDLLNSGDEVYGTCVLETVIDGDETTVRRLCEDSDNVGFRDDGMAVVESSTLEPISSERVLVDPEDETITTFTGEYREDEVVLHYRQSDLATPDEVEEERETIRELPEPDEASPDPGFYDDESLFWLMRGIPLVEGWEGAYNNVNLGTARLTVAEVLVEEQETIEVPAGTFETWRVRLRTASITQRIWIEVGAPHRMIRAEIERATYELQSFE